VTGIDFSGRAVAFCQKHYRMENLRFLRAEAEHLPFRRESFDAVVNVESSHCYPSMGRFLREVERVLRPGGCFLFADLRARGAVEELREQLRRSGLTVAEEERITPNVLRALEADSERRLALIECKTPRLLRQPFRQFAGVKGSPVYKAFRSGEWEYLRFVLRKDA
jgi:SAM-dependent methyltransferase